MRRHIMSRLRLALAFIVVFLFTACMGKDFVRPPVNSLTLGTTTMQQVQHEMGHAGREELIFSYDMEVRTITYSYTALLERVGGLYGVKPAKIATFYFHNDVLVGYQFLSSFPEDSTDFIDARWAIQKGITDENQVLKFCGRPSGELIYPMIADKQGKRLMYSYFEASGTHRDMKTYTKGLTIDLDENGIVTNLDSVSFRDRFNPLK